MSENIYHITYDDRVKQIRMSKDGWVNYLPVEMAVAFRNELNIAIYEARGFEVPAHGEPVEPGSYKKARGIMRGNDDNEQEEYYCPCCSSALTYEVDC